MHAVVVRVLISDFERARQALDEVMIPRVSSEPSFVAGYWLAPIDGHAMSVVVLSDERSALRMQEIVESGLEKPTDAITLESCEVREVLGFAPTA